MTEEELAAAGVQVVADEQAPVPSDGALVITRAQADRILAEQAAGGGLLGVEVDNLAPMPTGSPPLSYLIAAWTSKQPTPSARLANRLLGKQDWHHAQQVVYPLAVVSLFITDFTRPLSKAPELPSEGGGGGAPAGITAIDPCGDITAFLAKVLKTVFDALKLKPGKSGGLFSFVGWLAAVWNLAVGLAQGVVQAVVDKLTKPIFDTLRSAIGALAVATLVVSYFTKQTLRVSLQPGGPYRFAVGSEPDISGEFVAIGDKVTAKWPDALVKCAEVAKKKLPDLLAAGSPANWKLLANDGPVIGPGPLKGTVGADLTARLRFTTGRETPEDAAGSPATGRATVRVEVQRHELRDLLAEAKSQVRGVLSSLTSSLPIPPSVLNAIFDPMLDLIERQIDGRASGAFTIAGTGTVTVVFHKAQPKPKPTPTPSKSGAGDFCTQYRAMAKWSFENQAQPTPAAWAAELVRRLTAMRPPADKAGWVNSLVRVYRLVAANAGGAAIGNEVAASNFPAAGTGLAAYCKVNPAWLQPR